MKRRVAIYARYSADLQKATSITDQVAMAQKYCDEQGYDVVEIFTDEEITGRHLRRPGFQELKKAVEERRIDLVVVEMLDRLSRRTADALHSWELLKFSGVDLFSIKEGQQDFLTVLLRGYGAQAFSESVGFHTRRGMQGALGRGRLHTSAFGYRVLSEKTEGLSREVDAEQAVVVLRIYEEAAAGKSALQIAHGLNADGIKAPRGGTWDASTIRGNRKRGEGILHNRLYIGEAQVCRTTQSYHPETGARRVDLSPNEMVSATFPELQIVPDKLWAAVQAKLKEDQVGRTENPVRSRRRKHLFSGLMVCGCCGAHYVKMSSTSFACNEGRKKACKNRTNISQKRLERRVFGRLRDAFRSPELFAAFEAALREERQKLASFDPATEIARLESLIRKEEAKQESIFRAIEEGAPFAAFRARSKAIDGELTALRARLEEASSRGRVAAHDLPDTATLFARAVDAMETLLGDPDLVHQAHTYLRNLITRIVLVPDPAAEHGVSIKLETDFAALLGGADTGHAHGLASCLMC
ncbi:Site-specific DNA recombinase [Pseudooceanicola nitratireducens]|uniref:Site-specific DNA recombinase n=1 Tax=Pseudooceanicola nitratireducens TaxID=517719 RepID=A0A1I1JTK8_9RHOB|nr:recombinase family protein [Pseudooceanicola nitratireducens]SEJ52039.1 Site-specific DNA recombinase [Pseudooceanicola nitratireducens]SFC51904.1 Site-specific DNA recombinase [Pseudooceanicola nitratireducens]